MSGPTIQAIYEPSHVGAQEPYWAGILYDATFAWLPALDNK